MDPGDRSKRRRDVNYIILATSGCLEANRKHPRGIGDLKALEKERVGGFDPLCQPQTRRVLIPAPFRHVLAAANDSEGEVFLGSHKKIKPALKACMTGNDELSWWVTIKSPRPSVNPQANPLPRAAHCTLAVTQRPLDPAPQPPPLFLPAAWVDSRFGFYHSFCPRPCRQAVSIRQTTHCYRAPRPSAVKCTRSFLEGFFCKCGDGSEQVTFGTVYHACPPPPLQPLLSRVPWVYFLFLQLQHT